MRKLAIFDLDGTLLDTLKDLGTSCNVALETHGYEVHKALDVYKQFVGSGIAKLIERALPESARTPEIIGAVKATFETYYAIHQLDQTAPYSGIMTLLEALQEAGVQMAVVSNKADVYTKALVAQFFGATIPLAIGQREGVPVKPHPQSVEEVMAYYQVAKEDCIYIGDSDIDMLTAKAAQVTSVGVLWGFRSAEELMVAGASYLAASPTELLGYILTEA